MLNRLKAILPDRPSCPLAMALRRLNAATPQTRIGFELAVVRRPCLDIKLLKNKYIARSCLLAIVCLLSSARQPTILMVIGSN